MMRIAIFIESVLLLLKTISDFAAWCLISEENFNHAVHFDGVV
jgi:hypothetical protein